MPLKRLRLLGPVSPRTQQKGADAIAVTSRNVSFGILGFTALTILMVGISRNYVLPGRAANAQSKVPYSETQRGMNEAASRNFARADAEMNRAYRKLIGSVNQATQAKLRNSQRHWLKFRDAEAGFLSMTVFGGSAYPMVYDGNRATLTQARTRELNDAYRNFHTEGMM